MDEQLQAKVQEARDAGYSDEEINQYLSSKDQPLTAEQPIDRSGEYGAVAQQMIPDAVKYGLEGAGALYAGKKVLDAVRGPAAPAQMPQPGVYKAHGTGVTPPTYNAPLQHEPVLNETWDRALKQPTSKPSMVQQGTRYAQDMQRIAAEKVKQMVGEIGPAAQRVAGAVRPIAPAAIGAAAALMPGNAGQNYSVPQSGPMRGMEINPNTGRPWTQQELAQLR